MSKLDIKLGSSPANSHVFVDDIELTNVQSINVYQTADLDYPARVTINLLPEEVIISGIGEVGIASGWLTSGIHENNVKEKQGDVK